MSKSDVYFIGVDVGTGSVRAALVNDSGKILNVSTSVIKIWNPQADYYEQSSDDIWKTCCNTIKVSLYLSILFLSHIYFFLESLSKC